MSFKKLDQDAIEFMGRDGITEILEPQKLAWRKIREGRNLLILDEEQKGKSMSLSQKRGHQGLLSYARTTNLH
jgi:Lhr-like helicase